jgi:hypothetical protein
MQGRSNDAFFQISPSKVSFADTAAERSSISKGIRCDTLDQQCQEISVEQFPGGHV